MFEELLSQYGDIVWIFVLLINLVLNIIQFFKTGRISSRTKSILESENMKYRLPNYRETENSPSQTFDIEVPQYRLNKSSNELEELPDKLDIQQLVDSSASSSLDNMLSSLEPVLSDEDKIIDLHNDQLDDLDRFREADDYRLEVCERYGLSPYTSFKKVLEYLQTQEAETRGQISVLQQQKNIKKEDIYNGLSKETPQDTQKPETK